MTTSLEQLKYPIGKLSYSGPYDEATQAYYREQIRNLPEKLRALTEGLSEAQRQRTYRSGGWSVQQLVHHIADSHLNSIIRFKLALTEENPPIKPYKEAAWAELRDISVTPIEVSVKLLEALHTRWSNLLDGFSGTDWQRTVYHPEKGRQVSLDEFLGHYAWHGEHHLAHIRMALGE